MAVYFIRAASGPIKIGKSSEPFKRFEALQTASFEDLTLLGIAHDLDEAELHQRFSQHHLSREWFNPAPEILALADKYRETTNHRRSRIKREPIIDLLGGTNKVADLCGITQGAVSQWRTRGVPWRWRAVIAKAALERGIELPPYLAEYAPFVRQSEAA